MHRRTVLAALAVVASGGCLDTGRPEGDSATSAPTETTAVSTTPTATTHPKKQVDPDRREFGRVETTYRPTGGGSPAEYDPTLDVTFRENTVVVDGVAIVACQDVRVASAGYDGDTGRLTLTIAVEREEHETPVDCGQGAQQYRVTAAVEGATPAVVEVTQRDSDGETVTETARR
jgi:hypothetical protein